MCFNSKELFFPMIMLEMQYNAMFYIGFVLHHIPLGSALMSKSRGFLKRIFHSYKLSCAKLVLQTGTKALIFFIF